MAQASGPISQGTLAERQFTDVLWRDLFGDESGVVGDVNGTAYKVTLPPDSDVVSVGSTTQRSIAKVGGFAHVIPAGSTESLTIPAAVSGTRNDIIALRYDPSYTGLPGPVRLVRIAGTSSGLPTYDDAPPGVEDLPLWSVSRTVGQALSQATVKRLFPRIGPMLTLADGAPLPLSSPLGTRLRQGGIDYVRELNNASTPVWVPEPAITNGGTSGVLAGTAPPAGAALIQKTFDGAKTFNSNGETTVTYPGSFPNGVVSVHAQVHSAGNPFFLVVMSSTLGSTNIKGWNLATGNPTVGLTYTVTVTATGW